MITEKEILEWEPGDWPKLVEILLALLALLLGIKEGRQ